MKVEVNRGGSVSNFLSTIKMDETGSWVPLEDASRILSEIERLLASEAELFDKCGELQNKLWKLEAARAAGGGDE